MNYCDINEAWGMNNFANKIRNNINDIKKKNIIENFDGNINTPHYHYDHINDDKNDEQKDDQKELIDSEDMINTDTIENLEDTTDYYDIIKHIMESPKLKKKVENKFNVKITKDKDIKKQTKNFFTKEMKEIIFFISIGIFIILILDLFVQIGRNLHKK